MALVFLICAVAPGLTVACRQNAPGHVQATRQGGGGQDRGDDGLLAVSVELVAPPEGAPGSNLLLKVRNMSGFYICIPSSSFDPMTPHINIRGPDGQLLPKYPAADIIEGGDFRFDIPYIFIRPRETRLVPVWGGVFPDIEVASAYEFQTYYYNCSDMARSGRNMPKYRGMWSGQIVVKRRPQL